MTKKDSIDILFNLDDIINICIIDEYAIYPELYNEKTTIRDFFDFIGIKIKEKFGIISVKKNDFLKFAFYLGFERKFRGVKFYPKENKFYISTYKE